MLEHERWQCGRCATPNRIYCLASGRGITSPSSVLLYSLTSGYLFSRVDRAFWLSALLYDRFRERLALKGEERPLDVFPDGRSLDLADQSGRKQRLIQRFEFFRICFAFRWAFHRLLHFHVIFLDS